ncbi:hypothetical protein V3C99_012306 [Haemonchus contortus]
MPLKEVARKLLKKEVSSFQSRPLWAKLRRADVCFILLEIWSTHPTPDPVSPGRAKKFRDRHTDRRLIDRQTERQTDRQAGSDMTLRHDYEETHEHLHQSINTSSEALKMRRLRLVPHQSTKSLEFRRFPYQTPNAPPTGASI